MYGRSDELPPGDADVDMDRLVVVRIEADTVENGQIWLNDTITALCVRLCHVVRPGVRQ